MLLLHSSAFAGGIVEPTPSAYWTTFTPSVDSRQIYVSSSTGSNANSGLAIGLPKATVAAGEALMRTGFPDIMYLKRGDTFTEALPGWTKSGRSASERMVVAAYGTGARPIFKTGSNTACDTSGLTAKNYLLFQSLDFYDSVHDPLSGDFTGGGGADGLHLRSPTVDQVWEDCAWRFYGGSSIQGNNGTGMTGLAFRRCQFLDNYGSDTGAHSEGMYMDFTSGVTYDECFFDHNGWNETLTTANPNVFNHNLYIDTECTNTVVSNCIFLRASSHGCQFRCGGLLTGNFCQQNPIGLLFGGGAPPLPGGISGTSSNNIVVRGINLISDLGNPKQYGISYTNVLNASSINNIVSNALDTNAHDGIGFDPPVSGGSFTQSGDIVHNWPVGQHLTPVYADPNRDLASYDTTLGGPGTLAHFITLLRAQRKDSWNDALGAQTINAYVRAGFV